MVYIFLHFLTKSSTMRLFCISDHKTLCQEDKTSIHILTKFSTVFLEVILCQIAHCIRSYWRPTVLFQKHKDIYFLANIGFISLFAITKRCINRPNCYTFLAKCSTVVNATISFIFCICDHRTLYQGVKTFIHFLHSRIRLT